MGCDLTADGTIQALGWQESTRIFELVNGAWQQRGEALLPGCISPGSIALTPEGEKIAIARVNQQTFSWQVDIYSYQDQNYSLEGVIEIFGVGNEVSLSFNESGQRLVVGIMHANANSGTATVYQFNGTFWGQLGQQITGSGSVYLGKVVDISMAGDVIAIGSLNEYSNRGSVRIMDLNGDNWQPRGQVIYGYRGDQACQVSLRDNGNRFAVGGEGNDLGGNRAGQVRIFEWSTSDQS